MSPDLIAALSWDPEIKGALYVLLAVGILAGSCYLLLATNMGARLGFLLACAGLLGWLTTNGVVWWVYGQGISQKAPQAAWKQAATVTGELGGSSRSFLEDYPKGWRRLDPGDKEVADAIPIAEGELVSSPGGPPRPFRNASDFVLVAAYEKGGDRKGPFGVLNFRPFNVFHEARYLAIQVQKVQPQPEVPGAPAPRPEPDPTAEPISIVLLRDLGAKRLYPGVFTISCGILFGLVCYQLHVRDREAAARREAQTGTEQGKLQPVGR